VSNLPFGAGAGGRVSSKAHLPTSAPLSRPEHQARYPASYPAAAAWRCRPSPAGFLSTFVHPTKLSPGDGDAALGMTGIGFLGILFPTKNSASLTVGLPARPQATGTLPGFPCSARMRYGREGCLLYSGAVVSSRPTKSPRSAPAVSQRPALSPASRIPPAEATVTKHTKIHLCSPLRPSPRPLPPGGTAAASAFTPGFAPRSHPRRTPRRRQSHGHWIGSHLHQNLQTT
jgi:hypothetical protein